MKIIFDPVYTGLPSTCSTSYLVWELIREFVKVRDDAFFYVLYPTRSEVLPEEMEFLNSMPDRVQLIALDQNPTDRVSELFSTPPGMKKVLAPIGSPCWDADIVISSRIPMLPHMRPLSAREVAFGTGSIRAFYGLEEMPFLSFRNTVPWNVRMELQTLVSYLLCDKVFINNQWTMKALLNAAKALLAPAKVMQLRKKVVEVVPVKLQRLNVSTGRYKDTQDFNVAFVGRVTGTRSFDKIEDMFKKQFSYPVGKNKKYMKFSISTNSRSFGGSGGADDFDFVDVQFNGRAEFHKYLKKQHVVLNLSEVEDFSLSTYETLLAGIPIIVYDKPWNTFLGANYPFRAESPVEVYAMLNAFAADYTKEYAKFMVWEASVWKALVEGPDNKTTFEALLETVTGFEASRHEYLIDRGLGGSYLEIADSIAAGASDEVDLLVELGSRGVKIVPECQLISRAPNPLMLKILMVERGFVDTNKTGVMRRL